MQAAGASFPKEYRLLKRVEFTRLSHSVNVIKRQAFLVVWQKGTNAEPRIGITASKKVGGAVVRNRIKRHVRECFRHNCHLLPLVDLVVIARRQAAAMDGKILQQALVAAFEQIGSR